MRKSTLKKTNYPNMITEGKEFYKAQELFELGFDSPSRSKKLQGGFINTRGVYGENVVIVFEDGLLSCSPSLTATFRVLLEDPEFITSANKGSAILYVVEKNSKKYGKYYLPVLEYGDAE